MPPDERIALRPRSLTILAAYYAAVVVGLATMRLPGGGWIAFAAYYLLLPLGAVAVWRATTERWLRAGARPLRSQVWRAASGAAAGAAMLGAATLLAQAAGWLTVERLPGLGTLFGLAAQQLLVAGIEEGAFRGVIQRLLAARLGPAQGLVIASFMFGLFHLPNIAEQSVPGRLVPLTLLNLTLMGWVFGGTYQRAGSLALPFGLHFGWNMVSYSIEDWGSTVFHAPDWWIGSANWFPESGLLAGLALLALLGIQYLAARAGRGTAQPPAT